MTAPALTAARIGPSIRLNAAPNFDADDCPTPSNLSGTSSAASSASSGMRWNAPLKSPCTAALMRSLRVKYFWPVSSVADATSRCDASSWSLTASARVLASCSDRRALSTFSLASAEADLARASRSSVARMVLALVVPLLRCSASLASSMATLRAAASSTSRAFLTFLLATSTCAAALSAAPLRSTGFCWSNALANALPAAVPPVAAAWSTPLNAPPICLAMSRVSVTKLT